MIPLYGIIGTILVIVGVVYLYIFLRYLVRSKKNYELIIAVSEALITIAIGSFYIYSVVVIANNSKDHSVNFTNTLDDILLTSDTFEYYFTTKSPVTEETSENYQLSQENSEQEIENNLDVDYNKESSETINKSTVDPTTSSADDYLYTEESLTSTTSTTTEKASLPMEINKTEQFIKNYQTFIKEFIKQKVSNTSIFNQTFTNMKFGPPKIKTSREIKFEPEEDTCFYNVFLGNALLLYSFTHCLLTLVSNTLLCRKCIETNNELKEESQDCESSINSKNDEVLDTSGSVSAPVGPLFESSNSKGSNDGPDLKLFQAKSAQSVPVPDTEGIKKPVISNQNSAKYKLILHILVTWILPIVGVIILYFSSKSEQILPNFEQNIKVKSNFTTSPIEPNIMNLIQNPANVTTNSSEVDNIVNRIYNIVNIVKEKVDKKTTYFTPVMVDVVYFLSHKPRHSLYSDICFTMNISTKLLYLFIFVISYFGVILFAKITETIAKIKNEEKAKQQNICFLSFTFLWLPSVIDLFYRMFVSQSSSSVASTIFLALGNINRLQTLMYNHLNVKNYVQKSNFVNPA